MAADQARPRCDETIIAADCGRRAAALESLEDRGAGDLRAEEVIEPTAAARGER
jgi:hypothetical protein